MDILSDYLHRAPRLRRTSSARKRLPQEFIGTFVPYRPCAVYHQKKTVSIRSSNTHTHTRVHHTYPDPAWAAVPVPVPSADTHAYTVHRGMHIWYIICIMYDEYNAHTRGCRL